MVVWLDLPRLLLPHQRLRQARRRLTSFCRESLLVTVLDQRSGFRRGTSCACRAIRPSWSASTPDIPSIQSTLSGCSRCLLLRPTNQLHPLTTRRCWPSSSWPFGSRRPCLLTGQYRRQCLHIPILRCQFRNELDLVPLEMSVNPFVCLFALRDSRPRQTIIDSELLATVNRPSSLGASLDQVCQGRQRCGRTRPSVCRRGRHGRRHGASFE